MKCDKYCLRSQFPFSAHCNNFDTATPEARTRPASSLLSSHSAPGLRLTMSSHLSRGVARHYYPTLWTRDARERVLAEYWDNRGRMSLPPITIVAPNPQRCIMHSFIDRNRQWKPIMVHPRLPRLKCGSILNILSWNLATFGSSRGDRDIKALQGMQDIYGTTPTGTVLMLQQLDAERLRQLLDDSWIQRNFKISNVDPLKPKYTYPNMRQRRETAHSITSSPWSVTEWETPRDFSIMFFSNDLPVLNCFRIPFMAQQGKDLLFADLPVSSLLPSDKQNAVLRLCTSHHDFYYKDSDPDWPPETLLMSKLFDGNLTLSGDVAAGFQAVSTNMVHYDGQSPRMNGRPKHKDAWR